jgi:hypothetical protein
VANGNSGNEVGGGIIDDDGTLVLRNVRLTGNTAPSGGGLAVLDGGGVATSSPSTTRITGTVVARNVAGRVGGGIINGATMVLRGDRVVFNRAGSGGGGIFNDGTLSLLFTLVAFNPPDNCSPQGTIRGCHH